MEYYQNRVKINKENQIDIVKNNINIAQLLSLENNDPLKKVKDLIQIDETRDVVPPSSQPFHLYQSARKKYFGASSSQI